MSYTVDVTLLVIRHRRVVLFSCRRVGLGNGCNNDGSRDDCGCVDKTMIMHNHMRVMMMMTVALNRYLIHQIIITNQFHNKYGKYI